MLRSPRTAPLPKMAFCDSQVNSAEMVLQISTLILGPYDFRDAENADGITESSHKNGIYSLTRNVMEFVKVWMN